MTATNNRPVKAAYLTASNPFDKRVWSGAHYYILKALQKEFEMVIPFGPVNTKMEKWVRYFLRLFEKFCMKILKKNYIVDNNRILSGYYAKIFEKKLKGQNFDVIFATAAPNLICKLKTKIPIFHIQDATFSLLTDNYPYATNLIKISRNESNRAESEGIHKSAALAYSSKWAADSAIKDYGADPKKIHVVSFGANIDNIPQIRNPEEKAREETCNLLFVGRNWFRKGGPMTVDILKELNAVNLKATLTMVGIARNRVADPNIKVIPYLDKNNPIQLKEYEALMEKSHFLLLPTKADCTPIVFCEAAAFGLPVITADVGGVSSVVENGVTGYTLSEQSTAKDYARCIVEAYGNKDKYTELSKNARERFEKKLNWEAWGSEIKAIYAEKIATQTNAKNSL